jgi:hypothetical protein
VLLWLSLGVTAALLLAFFDARPSALPVTLPGRDSVVAIVQWLSRGLLLGAVLGASTGALTCFLNGCVAQGQGTPTGLPPGMGALIGGLIGCVAVLAMSVRHASGRSVGAKDAHARGVLRQRGALYQFRHLRLQERLSGRPPGQG